MDSLIVPPSPNWYEADIMACAADNTLLYGSRQDFIIIKPTEEDKPDDIHILTKAHFKWIVSVSINRNWGAPHKYAVTASEDKVIKLWDIDTITKKIGHNKHVLEGDLSKILGAHFAGDDRVISATDNGNIVIWNTVNNETTLLSSVFGNNKVTITCFSICPHATWLAAFGMKNGLVVTVDLRKQGKVIHHLRGHAQSVVSFAWCPAPVNVFPKNTNNSVGEARKEGESANQTEGVGNPFAQLIADIAAECNNGNNCKDTQKKNNCSSKASKKQTGENKKTDAPNINENFTPENLKSSKLNKSIHSNGDTPTDLRCVSMEICNSIEREPVIITNSAPEQNDLPATETNQSTPTTDRTSVDMEISYSIEKIGTPVVVTEVEDSKFGGDKEPSDWEKKSLLVCSEIKSKLKVDEDNSVPTNTCNIPELGSECREELPNVDESRGAKSLNSSNSSNVFATPPESSLLESCCSSRNMEMEVHSKITQDTPSQVEQHTKFENVKDMVELVRNEENDESNRNDASDGPSRNESQENWRTMPTTVFEKPPTAHVLGSSELDDVKEAFNVAENHLDVSAHITEEITDTLGTQLEETEMGAEVRNEEEAKSYSKEASDSVEESGSKDESSGQNWRTKPPSLVEEPRREFLLASSAREDQICIWRAGTDGTCQHFLKVPKPNRYKRFKGKDKEHFWIVLCWAAPTVLFTSARSGEVIMWSLPPPRLLPSQGGSVQFAKLHHNHTTLMSLKAPAIYSNQFNFLEKRTLNVWSCGQERTLCNYDANARQLRNYYQTLSGSVNCFAGSPVDPCRLAIGGDDRYNYIKVWNLSQTSKKLLQLTNYYDDILGSVTALAWHPSEENLLAWGTKEGRIGVTLTHNKSTKVLKHHFKTEIYKLEWGPHELSKSKEKRMLYAISNGEIAIFNVDEKAKEPELVQIPIAHKFPIYTFSWQPNYQCLMVGSKVEACYKFSSDLKTTEVFYLSSRMDCVEWHPNAESNSDIKYSQVFAAVLRGIDVKVFDLSEKETSKDLKVYAHFVNRTGKVRAVRWSPHLDNLLAVVDDAGVAQVFDIEAQTILYTYLNPWLDIMTSVYWSPLDSNYIILGTEKRKIFSVNITDSPVKNESVIKTQRNRINKQLQNEYVDLLPKEKKEKVEEKSNLKPLKKSLLLPVFYSMKEKTLIKDIEMLLDWKLGNKQLEGTIGDTSNIDILDVFGDKKGINAVLAQNLSSFAQNGMYDRLHKLALFQGDIQIAIKDAIDRKQVDMWVVSMAPMVSLELWKAACDTYIQQLLESAVEIDPFLLASLLLARHQPERAVQILCEKKLFREAYVLAKSRLSEDSEEIAETLLQWAKSCYFEGNYEFAACCYICLGKFGEAAQGLFRRTSLDRLQLTLKLANLSDNEELKKAVEGKLNEALLAENTDSDSEDASPESEPKDGIRTLNGGFDELKQLKTDASEYCPKEGKEMDNETETQGTDIKGVNDAVGENVEIEDKEVIKNGDVKPEEAV